MPETLITDLNLKFQMILEFGREEDLVLQQRHRATCHSSGAEKRVEARAEYWPAVDNRWKWGMVVFE